MADFETHPVGTQKRIDEMKSRLDTVKPRYLQLTDIKWAAIAFIDSADEKDFDKMKEAVEKTGHKWSNTDG